MEHRGSYNPTSCYSKHRLPHERERSGSGQKHPKRDHPKLDSATKSWQNPLGRQCLSSRKEHYERDFPIYKQPVEVGSFSLDSQRRFFNDGRQMRYYVQPDRSPSLDLRDGYRDRYVKRDDAVKERLDHLLRWVLENRTAVSSSQAVASPW